MGDLTNDRVQGNAPGEEPNAPIQETDFETSAPTASEPSVEEILQERDNYLDQLRRSVAEFANYRKRVEQDRARAREFANRDLLTAIVPLADDFQRALGSVPDSEADESWVEGVSLIERKLMGILEREGVSQIDALGKPFDPAEHEAVAVVPGSSGTTVVEVFQNGYRHGEQLLKPAMVQVGDPVPGDVTKGNQ